MFVHHFPMRVLLFLFVAVAACAPIEYVDDPVIGARIEVDTPSLALMPTDRHRLTARYFENYGLPQEAPLVWLSTVPAVAAVGPDGTVQAFSNGQTVVSASFNGVESAPIQVTVVSDENAVASVAVVTPTRSLAVGERMLLTATVKNIAGQVLTGRPIEWFSENETIATVSATGEVSSQSPGVVGIYAKSEGVKSNTVVITVGLLRDGTFVPSGGYQARGTAVLKMEAGQLVLELSSDFQTSFALGTYVYLANSTNGAQVRAGGFEVAQITTNGAKRFAITDRNPNINLFDYRYVIILCKPASVTFGFADLN
jgi:hypothetical protein